MGLSVIESKSQLPPFTFLPPPNLHRYLALLSIEHEYFEVALVFWEVSLLPAVAVIWSICFWVMKIPCSVSEIWDNLRGKPSNHKMRSLHVAVLVKRGKVISVAANALGSRSMGCGYSDQSIHAEKNVVKKLGDTRKLAGAILYVTRLAVHAKSSQPCYSCHVFLMKCMEKYGLKAVAYT